MKIANEFGSFYSKLGENHAKQIKNSVNHYISKIRQNLNSMVMNPTTQQESEKLIKEIPAKSSHGHDQISNVLLKSLCPSIFFPFCLIFTGVDLGGGPGAWAPPTTKNEATAPKFYKIEAPEWQF